MKKFLIAFSCLLVSLCVSAHPGRRDKDGCHVCRTNCAKYGVKEGVRHCHRPDGSIYYPGGEAAEPGQTPANPPRYEFPTPELTNRSGAVQITADSVKAYVEKVSDGDTIKVRLLPGGSEKLTVRLLGIDCPESHRNAKCKRAPRNTGAAQNAAAGKEGENRASVISRHGCDWQVPRGLKASRRAAALLKHKKVYLECGRKCKNGAYGRALRYVRLEEGLDYGLVMVREGLCEDFGWKYPHPRGKAYLKAQEQAKRVKRGIWGE